MEPDVATIWNYAATDVRTPSVLCIIHDAGLEFPFFKGEPDNGIAFSGQRVPFGLLEVGFSDSLEKTKSRARHWIVRGNPGVEFSVLPKLIGRFFFLCP